MSNRPLKYLSPHSQITRVQKSTAARKRLRKSLLKYEDALDIVVMGEHDDEMKRLVMVIEENGCEELDAIVAEAEHAGEGNGEALEDFRERDLKARRKFFEDKLTNRKYSSILN